MKEGWEIKTLKEIGKTQTGSTPPMSHKEYYNEDYMPFVKPSEINYDGLGNINYATQMLSKQGAAVGRVFEPYSIFMVCIGASIGKIGISDREISCNQQINILTPTDKYIRKFIYYAMRSPKFTNTVIKEGLSATATLPIINKSKWENLSIFIPPLAEQRKIVDFLDTQFRNIDALKNNAEQQLQAAKDLFQSALASLLTPQNNWETKTLKEIGKTQTGSTPPMSHKEYYNEDYMPFVKPSEINYDGLGNINYATQMLSKQGAAVGRVFEPYSIFMVCIGASIGKIGISDREISCNQQINILTPTDKYIRKFIYYAMRSPKFTNTVIKEGLSATATLPIINKSKWENLSISIPPLTEQQEIADKLDTLSGKVQSLQDNYTQTLTLCNDLKQALLKQIFD